MSEFNRVDVAGCNYTITVIEPYLNTTVTWEHTSSSQGDEYCVYDLDGTSEKGYEYILENKDRRVNYKTKQPQYFNTYSTIMFNIEKYEQMMPISHSTGKIPLYAADYTDGVAICDLRRIPKEKVHKPINEGGWMGKRNISKTTVNDTAKKEQLRFFIPKGYFTFFPVDNNKGIIRPTYEE